MAGFVDSTRVVFPEIKQIRAMLRDYPRSIRRKYMRAAFNAAAEVGERRLRAITPRGPTGNLKKSVKKKATSGYGLAGYETVRGGKGFHQGFLEFGTEERFADGRFASTFRSKTAGRGGKMQILVGSRSRKTGGLVTKSPNYPKSFFKSAPAGQRVSLKTMPIGGRLGSPPVRTAFDQARGQITSVLKQQMATVLERANKDMARRNKK